MLKLTALLLLAFVAIVVSIAAAKPDQFRVERSTRIQAPPERVFALINDLQQMKRWNPYEHKDPALKGEFGATTTGPGASYAWQSDKVGSGRMTIVSASAPTQLQMRLDFIKPFAAVNTAEYLLQPEGGGTRVTWAMHGPAPFISKLMQTFINFDRMIGQDFEDGLQRLKALAETTA